VNDNQPIYRQLRDRVVAIDTTTQFLKEGRCACHRCAMSPPTIASNPLTVLKGYQNWWTRGLRDQASLGMFVKAGARGSAVAKRTPENFSRRMAEVSATIQRLGLKPEELLDGAAKRRPKPTTPVKTRQREEHEAMTVIEARGLRKAFSTTIALHGIVCVLKEGRISRAHRPNARARLLRSTPLSPHSIIRENEGTRTRPLD